MVSSEIHARTNRCADDKFVAIVEYRFNYRDHTTIYNQEIATRFERESDAKTAGAEVIKAISSFKPRTQWMLGGDTQQ
jgi:hypothetical protein